jgi:hypothetical protein
MKNLFIGKWRITEMEQWDADYIDLVAPGYFEFRKNGTGEFQFGAIEGDIDFYIENVENQQRLEFSWMGHDEYDPVAGRGWAVIKNKALFGRIYFHMGDESWFKAKEQK